MTDMLNSEQRSAVKTCATIGHSWHVVLGVECCVCCGWPRSAVAERAGGTRKENKFHKDGE